MTTDAERQIIAAVDAAQEIDEPRDESHGGGCEAPAKALAKRGFNDQPSVGGNPRHPPARSGHACQVFAKATGLPSTRQAVFVRLSEVEREEVSWHWKGRTAKGKITILMGDPGLGKSWLTCDMTARTTRGNAWPDGGNAPCGDVIVLTAEDGLGDTVRPRVEDLGGDLSRVHVLTAILDHDGTEDTFSLDRDLAQLEVKIVETGAVLVTIDPFSAYLGKTDSYKDSDIRRVLTPLAALAERTGVALVAVMHLTKDEKRRAVTRGLGSMAFVAASRVTLAVGTDPDDEQNGRRIVVPVKSNLSEPAPALAFRLTDGRFCWDRQAPTDIDLDEVLGGVRPDDRTERADAKTFLLESLADGPVLSTKIQKDAQGNGIALRTLARAKTSRASHVHHWVDGAHLLASPVDRKSPVDAHVGVIATGRPGAHLLLQLFERADAT